MRFAKNRLRATAHTAVAVAMGAAALTALPASASAAADGLERPVPDERHRSQRRPEPNPGSR